MLEDRRGHAAQVFVELFDQRLRIGAFGHRGEADDIGKKNRGRNAHAAQAAVEAVGIIENFFDEIFRNVAFERAAGAHLLDAFQHILET